MTIDSVSFLYSTNELRGKFVPRVVPVAQESFVCTDGRRHVVFDTSSLMEGVRNSNGGVFDVLVVRVNGFCGRLDEGGFVWVLDAIGGDFWSSRDGALCVITTINTDASTKMQEKSSP